MLLDYPALLAVRHLFFVAWSTFWGFWLADHHWRLRPIIAKETIYRLVDIKTPEILPNSLDV